MLAVIPVRHGALPAGGAEAAAECGGRVLVVCDASDPGSPDSTAAPDTAEVGRLGHEVRILSLGTFAAGGWARALHDVLADEDLIVLPASPDGRDLAPRLAHRLGRPLFAGAVQVSADRITVSRRGGLDLHVHRRSGPAVATLQPGVRGVEPVDPDRPPAEIGRVPAPDPAPGRRPHDAEVVRVLPPDVTTMDLSEAPRILGGGAGLDSSERFDQLARLAASIGASVGATRVITDRNWVEHERQIGTTGVIVDPQLYVSFGISGAVQHTSGLGTPRHVISVNTDPHCPMMQMSDLAIVSDANAVLDELERRVPGGADRG